MLIDLVLLVAPDGAALLEQLVELLRRRHTGLVKGRGRHAIPGKRLLRADGNALRARTTKVIVDAHHAIDEGHTPLVADLHARATSCAFAFMNSDH